LDAFGTVATSSVPAPTVDLATYAGIKLEGTPGRQYRIASSLAVGGADWVTVTNIILPASLFTVIDPTSLAGAKRFYRAVEVLLP